MAADDCAQQTWPIIPTEQEDPGTEQDEPRDVSRQDVKEDLRNEFDRSRHEYSSSQTLGGRK